MWGNVESWEVWRDGPDVCMKFCDLFGDGEVIKLPRDQAASFMLALACKIAEPDEEQAREEAP